LFSLIAQEELMVLKQIKIKKNPQTRVQKSFMAQKPTWYE